MNTNQDWKPIESAPKDGTEFQAWLDIGLWEPRCRFNPDSEAFEIWGRVDYDRDDWDACGHLTASHWMPLPAAPGEPTETAAYTVVLDPDPRGVSVGVYQGSSCVYNGAHPIPTGAAEGEKDEQEFDAKLGAHIREWLRRHGWHPEDGEGEWEFAQRICYEAGRRDAAPYWARTYEDQDNYDQAVADEIKRVSARIERAGRPDAGDALAYGSPADVAQRIEQYLHHDGRKNSATQLLYEAMKVLRDPKLKGEA